MPPKRKRQAGRPALARGRVTASDRSPQAKPKARVRKPRLPPDPNLRRTTRAMAARIEGSKLPQLSQAPNETSTGMDRTESSEVPEREMTTSHLPPSVHVPEEAANLASVAAVQTEARRCEMGAEAYNTEAGSQSPTQLGLASQHRPDAPNENEPIRLNIGRIASICGDPSTMQATAEHGAARHDLIDPRYSLTEAGSPHAVLGQTSDRAQATAVGETALVSQAAPAIESFTQSVSTSEVETKRWKDHAFDEQVTIYLEDQWKRLHARVGSFAKVNFPNVAAIKVDWQSLTSNTKAKLLSLTPKAERYIGNELGGADKLFVSWIWQLLVKNLFSPDCVDKWSNPEWAAFGKLDRALRGNVTNTDNPFNYHFHGARGRMAQMLYMKYGSHANQDRLKEIILTEIKPITRYKDSNSSENPHTSAIMLESLDKLIKMATSIDLMIVGCRYHMVVDMNHPLTGHAHSFPYDQRSPMMESHPGPKVGSRRKRNHGRPVDLIVRPSIRAYGQRVNHSFAGATLGDQALVRPTVRRYHLCEDQVPLLVCVDQFPPNGETEHLDPDDRTDTESHDSEEEAERLFLSEYVRAKVKESREPEARDRGLN